MHVNFGLWRGEERDWAAVTPLTVDGGESPWFEALTWVCGNLVSLPSVPVRGGVHFVLLRFRAGLFWAVLIPVFSWGRFGWGSLFDLAGEEETLLFLRLVPASVSFIIESVMASLFLVDWKGANFGDGANFSLLRSCLKWLCTVFRHPVSDGLAALGFNLIAFLVGDLGCSLLAWTGVLIEHLSEIWGEVLMCFHSDFLSSWSGSLVPHFGSIFGPRFRAQWWWILSLRFKVVLDWTLFFWNF